MNKNIWKKAGRDEGRRRKKKGQKTLDILRFQRLSSISGTLTASGRSMGQRWLRGADLQEAYPRRQRTSSVSLPLLWSNAKMQPSTLGFYSIRKREREKKKKKNWPLSHFLRFFSLTPRQENVGVEISQVEVVVVVVEIENELFVHAYTKQRNCEPAFYQMLPSHSIYLQPPTQHPQHSKSDCNGSILVYMLLVITFLLNELKAKSKDTYTYVSVSRLIQSKGYVLHDEN